MTTLSKIEDTGYELNDEFIGWVRDHYNGDDFDIDDAIASFNETETEELFDNHHGIYIPKLFAELLLNDYELTDENVFIIKNSVGEVTTTFSDIDKDDLTILAEKADDLEYDGYWDIWASVLDNAKLTYVGKTWYLDQDGDLWLRSENYIYPEF